MSRNFMYGTRLQEMEQMMMSIPNFLPRTKGMFIIGQKSIDEKEEFKRCVYCSEYSKGGCRRLHLYFTIIKCSKYKYIFVAPRVHERE